MALTEVYLHAFLPRRVRIILWFITAIVLFLIIMPCLYLFIWCFWGTEVIGLLRSPGDPSIQWVRELLEDPSWQSAFSYSLLLSIGVSIAGTALVAGQNYISRFLPRRLDSFTFWLMIFVTLNPLIAYSLSMRYTGNILVLPEWVILAAGHLVIVVPLQYLIFEAAREKLPRDLLWAGQTLGARHWANFRHVFLPNSQLAVWGAIVVGFFVSFDEVVVAAFVIESSHLTVPLKLWRGLSQVVKPEPAVVAVFMLSTLILAEAIHYRALFASDKLPRRAFKDILAGLWQETVAFAVSSAVAWFALSPGGTGLLGVSFKIFGSALVGFLSGLIVGMFKARGPIYDILGTANAEDGEVRSVPRFFSFEGISDYVDKADALRGGGWVEMNLEDISRISRVCFARARGRRYIGTDRHVPSKFYKLYPHYLGLQLERELASNDVRIVLYNEHDLAEDSLASPDLTRRFVASHVGVGVLLLSVSWETAERIAQRVRLPSPDFGLFGGQFVLFFDPPQSEEPGCIKLRHVDGQLQEMLETFLLELVENANEVVIQDGLPVFRRLLPETRDAYKVSLSALRWRRA